MDDPLADGATPLDPEEEADLIPRHISTRAELNTWEQANIAKAVAWLAGRRRGGPVLSRAFLRKLHERMFGETWRWAGKFRRTGTNIGAPAPEIPERLANLLEDARHWAAHATYSPEEIATRFHHRLTWIHPFPNGNGRHARLMTDAFLEENGLPPFTWGSASLLVDGVTRKAYIEALRQADRGDYGPLIAFVRS
ncbi:MAG TPA: mobile mystery protein B [Gemmatimonadales bacterium]|nr:mobile mystery protein B [Gemmatimonadales bacterium]